MKILYLTKLFVIILILFSFLVNSFISKNIEKKKSESIINTFTFKEQTNKTIEHRNKMQKNYKNKIQIKSNNSKVNDKDDNKQANKTNKNCNENCKVDMQRILNAAYPIIKKMIDPSTNLNNFLPQKNSTDYFKGPLILKFPKISKKKIYFNIINNFIFKNSKIFQMLKKEGIFNGKIQAHFNKFPTQLKEPPNEIIKTIIKEVYNTDKLNKTLNEVEEKYKKLLEKLKEDYYNNINNSKNLYLLDEKKIGNLEEKIKNLSEEDKEKLIKLKNDYKEKVKKLLEEKENELKIIQQKDKEINELKALINTKIGLFEKEIKSQNQKDENEKKKLIEKMDTEIKEKETNQDKIKEIEIKNAEKKQEKIKQKEKEEKLKAEKIKQIENEKKKAELKKEKGLEQKEKEIKENQIKKEKEIKEKEKIIKQKEQEIEKKDNQIKDEIEKKEQKLNEDIKEKEEIKKEENLIKKEKEVLKEKEIKKEEELNKKEEKIKNEEIEIIKTKEKEINKIEEEIKKEEIKKKEQIKEINKILKEKENKEKEIIIEEIIEKEKIIEKVVEKATEKVKKIITENEKPEIKKEIVKKPTKPIEDSSNDKIIEKIVEKATEKVKKIITENEKPEIKKEIVKKPTIPKEESPIDKIIEKVVEKATEKVKKIVKENEKPEIKKEIVKKPIVPIKDSSNDKIIEKVVEKSTEKVKEIVTQNEKPEIKNETVKKPTVPKEELPDSKIIEKVVEKSTEKVKEIVKKNEKPEIKKEIVKKATKPKEESHEEKIIAKVVEKATEKVKEIVKENEKLEIKKEIVKKPTKPIEDLSNDKIIEKVVEKATEKVKKIITENEKPEIKKEIVKKPTIPKEESPIDKIIEKVVEKATEKVKKIVKENEKPENNYIKPAIFKPIDKNIVIVKPINSTKPKEESPEEKIIAKVVKKATQTVKEIVKENEIPENNYIKPAIFKPIDENIVIYKKPNNLTKPKEESPEDKIIAKVVEKATQTIKEIVKENEIPENNYENIGINKPIDENIVIVKPIILIKPKEELLSNQQIIAKVVKKATEKIKEIISQKEIPEIIGINKPLDENIEIVKLNNTKEDIQDDSINENKTEKVETKIDKKINLPSLYCMIEDSEDHHHFLMNNEKCKNLNYFFWKYVSLLSTKLQNGLVRCNNYKYNCRLEILVKFEDDKTTISINENYEKKMILKKLGEMTPGITSVSAVDFFSLGKNQMNDYVITYLYNFLLDMIKSVPYFSKYDLIFIAEGQSFFKMSEEIKHMFKRSIMSLVNIDDRFIIEWSNIHILNKNEQKIKEFLVVKHANNGYDSKDMISLNLNDHGISIFSDDILPIEKGKNFPNNNIDSLFNNNIDKSKTSLEISKGNSVEHLYNKNLEMKKNNFNIRNDNPLDYSDFIQNFNNRKDDIEQNNLRNSKNSYENLITFNEKISKILKDPIILKLEDYIKDSKANDNEISDEEKNFDINLIELKDKDKDKIKKTENKVNSLSKKIFKELYMKNLEKTIEDRMKKNEKKFNLLRFKEKFNEINFDDAKEFNENNNKRKSVGEKIKDLFLNDLRFCFNKDYFSKEFNFYGNGNFEKCLNFVEKINKKRNNATKISSERADNLSLNISKNLKQNKVDVEFNKNPKNFIRSNLII